MNLLKIRIKGTTPRAPRRAFTLIEIMVVVAIIALVAVMSMPSIRAMQAGNAKAQAYNNINAALQAARSYAIMNGVNTAARFQPNGKISLVYRVGKDTFRAQIWGGTPPGLPFPNAANNSEADYIYLPVLNFEPLEMPKGYAIFEVNTHIFSEPFYVCYNRDGTTAINEPICTALATGTPHYPVNPDFSPTLQYVWNTGSFPNSWSDFKTWIKYAEDPANVQPASIPYRRLARYFLIPENATTSKEDILDVNASDFDYRVDHYAGPWGGTTATTQLGICQTPDNWDKMPLFSNTTPAGTKDDFITNNIVGTQKFDTIHINPYTGRVIRPVE